MSSQSILKSKAFNKLNVNRLQVQKINIAKEKPNYLFSLVINNATFNKTPQGGNISFDKNSVESII